MRTDAERANRLAGHGNPFAPPRSRRGGLRACCMALAAHSLLAAALLWTVRTPVPVDLPMVQAEFWAQAEPPPPVPQRPEPVPVPTLPPPTQPTLQDLREAEIALEHKRQQMQRLEQLERERQQWLEQEQQAQAERERQEAERQAAEAQALAEKKAAEERAQQAAREQAEAEKKAAQEAKALAEAERKAAEKRAAEARRRQQEQAAAERRRQDQIRRMQEMAGNRNAPPSAEYDARVKALILSKTTYPATSAGNPRVQVRIHVAPDGRIVKAAITQASGTPAWDSAVLRALQKTAALPPDSDGRMPYGGAYIDIDFRPYD